MTADFKEFQNFIRTYVKIIFKSGSIDCRVIRDLPTKQSPGELDSLLASVRLHRTNTKDSPIIPKLSHNNEKKDCYQMSFFPKSLVLP